MPRMGAGRDHRSTMFARWRYVLRILPAIVAVAPGAVHALLETDEAAIAAASSSHAAAQILAPRIILGLSAELPIPAKK